MWFPPGRFSTPCPIDISTFPFDVQTCSLTFQSWIYGGFQLNLTLAFDMVDVGIMNGEWSLIGKRTFCRSILFPFLTMYRLNRFTVFVKSWSIAGSTFCSPEVKAYSQSSKRKSSNENDPTNLVILCQHGIIFSRVKLWFHLNFTTRREWSRLVVFSRMITEKTTFASVVELLISQFSKLCILSSPAEWR